MDASILDIDTVVWLHGACDGAWRIVGSKSSKVVVGLSISYSGFWGHLGFPAAPVRVHDVRGYEFQRSKIVRIIEFDLRVSHI